MIRVEIELSVPSTTNGDSVSIVSAVISKAVSESLFGTGAVIHRILVEETDA